MLLKRIAEKDFTMAISSFCIGCILRRQEERIRELAFPEETKSAFMKELCALIAKAPQDVTTPVLVADIRVLMQKYFGIADSYEAEKKHYNRLMLDSEDVLEQMIGSADEPLKEALRLARIGNYIDFGALNEVSEQRLGELFAESENDTVDEAEWNSLKADLQKGKTLVYLTDNCGEIVVDKLFIKEIQKAHPQLDIAVIVRGQDVLNDATMEDAKAAGLTEIVKVIGNGSAIAGNSLGYISAEAEDLIRTADVVISKGQGNFESLNGCGLNIYYLFLCKCDWFVRRFKMKRLTGVLINDGNLEK